MSASRLTPVALALALLVALGLAPAGAGAAKKKPKKVDGTYTYKDEELGTTQTIKVSGKGTRLAFTYTFDPSTDGCDDRTVAFPKMQVAKKGGYFASKEIAIPAGGTDDGSGGGTAKATGYLDLKGKKIESNLSMRLVNANGSPACTMFPAPSGKLKKVSAKASAAAKRGGVKLSIKEGFPVDISDAGLAINEYDLNYDDDPSVSCGKGLAPLAVGWRNAHAPVAGASANLGENPYFELEPRRPVKGGKLQAIGLCAKGKVKATVKKSAADSVSCGTKLALGIAATETDPYIEAPVVTGPTSPGGWSAKVGSEPQASAVCIAASAVKRVTTVRKAATFAAGTASTTIKASCSGGRKGLAWGYEAAVTSGNRWSSSEDSQGRTVPFVSDAVPSAKGKTWAITFSTPDVKPATADAAVAVTLRCAVPAG